MIAMELVTDPDTKEPAAALTARSTRAATSAG